MAVTFNLESGTFTRKIKEYENPHMDPKIDLNTDAYLGDRVQRIFDNELGVGRSSRTDRTLFDGLPNPTVEDLLEYCKNPAFRKFNGTEIQQVFDIYGREGISFGTDWCP